MINRSGKGASKNDFIQFTSNYHYEVISSELVRPEEMLVDLLGGDPQSKDLARKLRPPRLISLGVNRLFKVICYDPNNGIDTEELEIKLIRRGE